MGVLAIAEPTVTSANSDVAIADTTVEDECNAVAEPTVASNAATSFALALAAVAVLCIVATSISAKPNVAIADSVMAFTTPAVAVAEGGVDVAD
jgi:hypothetical protein